MGVSCPVCGHETEQEIFEICENCGHFPTEKYEPKEDDDENDEEDDYFSDEEENEFN